MFGCDNLINHVMLMLPSHYKIVTLQHKERIFIIKKKKLIIFVSPPITAFGHQPATALMHGFYPTLSTYNTYLTTPRMYFTLSLAVTTALLLKGPPVSAHQEPPLDMTKNLILPSEYR